MSRFTGAAYSWATVAISVAVLGCDTTGTGPAVTAKPAASPVIAEGAPATRLASSGPRRGAQLGAPQLVKITPDGREVLFLKMTSPASGQALYVFDLATGAERVLLTAEKLVGSTAATRPATAPPPEGGTRRGRGGAPGVMAGIAQYLMSLDGSTLIVTAAGRQFTVDRATLASREITGIPTRLGYKLSADGKTIAFHRDSEVWSLDLTTMSEHQLTRGAGGNISFGVAEFVSQEEFDRRDGFWLAADGKHLAYQRTDTTGMEVLTAEDVTHQEAAPYVSPYPRPGKRNADVRLFISATSGSGRAAECTWDHDKYPYLAQASWSEPGAPLTVVLFNRLQTELVVMGFTERGGEGKLLHRETDPAWVNLTSPAWLAGGRKFLWLTERNGSNQLELHDVASGRATVLTTPEFGFQSVLGSDASAGVAYVTAGQMGEAPRVYRVPLDPAKGQPELVTAAPGTHAMTFARAGGTWLDMANLDGKTTWEVHSAGNGKAGELGSMTLPVIGGGPNVEIGWIDAIDPALRGIKYHYAVVRPRDFDASKKYPVIVSVYAGPSVTVVREDKRAYVRDQLMADRGAIVVMLDGRGTPGRGRDWERCIKGNLIDIQLTDQVAGLKALCAKYPEMDAGRVGVHGWSFGGYFSAMAAMRRPDVFKVAVAGAPVAAWEDYDTAYTERYLDLPENNPAGYRASSVLTYCKDLRVPLLIIHGTADDNVYLMHSMKIVRALIDAGKDFDFLPMPGSHHGPGDPATSARVNQKTTDFLFSHL